MASNPLWIESPDQLGSAPPTVVHAMIEALIEWVDLADGDPDLEENGLEDDFLPHHAKGPGCPIADPDCCAAFDDIGTDYGASATLAPVDGLTGDPDDAEVTWREADYGASQTPGMLRTGPDDAEDDDDDQCAAGDDDLSNWGWRASLRVIDGHLVGYREDRPGDPEDAETAWTERTNQTRHPDYRPGTLRCEDAEDDDPAGGTGMEDEFDTRSRGYHGPGCPVSDPGGCEHDGREIEDAV